MSENADPGIHVDAQTTDADILLDDFLRRLSIAPPYEPLGVTTTASVRILDGDLSKDLSTSIHRWLHPDAVATAILIARRLAEDPSLLEQIHGGDTWGIVWTSNFALLESVLHVMQHCVLSPGTTLISEYDFELLSASDRGVVTFVRRPSPSSRDKEGEHSVIMHAIAKDLSIIGVSSKPFSELPAELEWRADWQIHLGELDVKCLDQVASAITGYPLLFDIDPELAPGALFNSIHFPVCFALDEAKARDVQREIFANLDRLTVDGPRLEELAGFGSAQQWGLNLAADLNFYRAGKLDWSELEIPLRLEAEDGAGKHLFVKALSRSARVPVVEVDCVFLHNTCTSEMMLSSMREAFAMANEIAPSILFFSDLDVLLPAPSQPSLLLEFLEHLESSNRVIVIASIALPRSPCDDFSEIDIFRTNIRLDLPGSHDLLRILRYYLRDDLADIDLSPVVIAGRYKLGLDVKTWVQRARARAEIAGRPLCIDDVVREATTARI